MVTYYPVIGYYPNHTTALQLPLPTIYSEPLLGDVDTTVLHVLLEALEPRKGWSVVGSDG